MPIRGSKGLGVLTLVCKVALVSIAEPLPPLRTKVMSSSVPKLTEGSGSKALSTILGELLSFFAFFVEGPCLGS